MTLNSTLQYVVTIVVIAALTVLAAMNKVDGSAAVAAIVGLGGVHIGGQIANVGNTAPTPTTTTTNQPVQ